MSGQTINCKQYYVPKQPSRWTQGVHYPLAHHPADKVANYFSIARLPMPQSAIMHMEDKMATDKPHLLTFTDKNGSEIGDAD